MTQTEYIVGVDVGGTWTRALLFETSAKAIEKIREQVDTSCDMAISDQIIKMIYNLCKRNGIAVSSLKGIGIASAGPLDSKKGLLIKPPNLPFDYVPLVEPIKQKLNVPTFLINDCAAAVLSEKEFGGGKGIKNLFYVTISTGIGSGIIIDDRLLLGEKGIAAEIGHVTVLPDGPMCGCGRRGHLEALASGTAIARWVKDKLAQGAVSTLPQNQTITTEMIANAAKSGDTLSTAALERAGRLIGQALANLLHIFNPTAIIIGGGVSQSGAILLEPMQAAMKEYTLSPSYLDNLILTRAAFGDEVGLVGALALGRSRYPYTKHNHD